jgi:hypothetical protein
MQAKRTYTTREILAQAVFVLATGAFFAWLAPYETENMSSPWRFLFWTSTMAVGTTAGVLFFPRLLRRPSPPQRLLVILPIVAAVVTLPVTALIAVIDLQGGSFYTPTEFALQLANVFVVSIGLTILWYAVDRMRHPDEHLSFAPAQPQAQYAPGDAAPGVATALDPFRERLPARLKSAEIYAVEADDHYLRVHTSAGQELILLRLADAVRELSTIEGLQTHRSWWVARQGVAETVRDNGRLTLKLKSGVEAPVSRTYAPTVRAANWG